MTFTIPQPAKVIEPGTYKAQLEKVEIRTGGKFTSDINPDGNYRMWHWLIDVNGNLEAYSDTTSMFTGPKSESFKRLTALLGKAPVAGEQIETPTGKTVLLTLSVKENGFNKIEAVSPYVEPQQALPGVPR